MKSSEEKGVKGKQSYPEAVRGSTKSVFWIKEKLDAYSIKHERSCLTTFPHTEKRVQNKTRSRVFLTNFELFGSVAKHSQFDVSSQLKLKIRRKWRNKS